MQLVVTAVVVVCASSLMAQTDVTSPPVPKPMVLPQSQMHRPGIRQAGAPKTAQGNAKAVSVLPTATVVTLKGACKDRQAKGSCETVITREDLDRFVSATAPDAGEMARGRLAIQYARTAAFSALAEQQGLEKNPALAKEIAAQVKLVRMRLLASAYLQNVQSKTSLIAEAEIQKYYDTHRDQYEQAQVRRLSVPVTVPTENGRPLDRAAAKAEMADLRSRAAAGEDFNQLQQDAYKHLHIQVAPPPVNVVPMLRRSLQGDEAKAFDLKPGELSDVLDLPAAFALIKIESKEPLPMASVRPEIEATLRGDLLQREVSKLSKTISGQFNLDYLRMPSQPDLFGGTISIRPTTSRASVRPTSPPALAPR